MADREIEKWITINGVHVPIYKDETEDDVKKRLEAFTDKKEEQRRTLTDEEKIYNELGIPVPKKSSDNLVGQHQEINNKIVELYDQLEKEKTLSDDPEIKALGKAYQDMFATYTNRGKEIQKEIKELREQQSKLDAELQKRRDASAWRDAEEYQKEILVWNQNKPKLVDITQKDYKGFSLDTKTSGMQDALEKGNAIIVEMSPKEYIQRISYDIFKSSITRGSRGVSMSNIRKYADEMKNGTKYDLPWIDYKNGGQEGRHRAMAAILNGYKTIPVAIKLK